MVYKYFFLCTVTILSMIGVQCVALKQRGENQMYENIETAIKKLDLHNDKGVTSIARKIKEESWTDPRKVVNILHSANKDEAKKAALVLLSIDELAMTPVLDSIFRKIPEKYVWDMDILVSNQLRIRAKIVKALNEMLLDKRILEDPDEPVELEEAPPSRRVCDDAYIMMRRLFAYEENDEELTTNIDVFLDMTDEERDAEIDRAKNEKKWTSLVEKAFDEVEDEEF
ncbi:MAG: hypothetical protein JSV50_08345 [Desulfobacteraceae bacterium]|nr:MAG: hypothetical protein JSV50_08345 [Desulfobacteraceae bacterium]